MLNLNKLFQNYVKLKIIRIGWTKLLTKHRILSNERIMTNLYNTRYILVKCMQFLYWIHIF